MRLAIRKKDHTVLLLSEITKDYHWFYQLLTQNDKITDDIVRSLHKNEKNFIENMLPILLQQAILEWKEKNQPPTDLGEDKEKWIRCSLCGTPNRYIHYIINKQSNKEINVGSDCVKEYAFNEGNTEHQRQKARKIRRLNLLNTELPGIKRKVENWFEELEKFDVWIPLSISKNYRNIGEELIKVYNNFLEGKGSEIESIGEIKNYLNQGEQEIRKFNEYVQTNRRNDFVVTKDIYNWIKQNMTSQSVQIAFDLLKSDGIITYQTAHRICETGFMKRIQRLLNHHLNEKNIEIKGFDNSEESYLIEIGELKNCKLYISHRELLQKFGWVLFNEEPFVNLNVVEFINSASIKDERSMDILLKAISGRIKRETVILKGYDYDFNEIVLFNKRSNKHSVHDLQKFVSQYKVLSIKYNKNKINQLSYEKGSEINIDYYKNSRDGYTSL